MMLKLKTSPRPETGTQLDSVELHFEHISYAGNRSTPHPAHFCTIRRPLRAPSKNSVMSGVIAGIGLSVLLEGIGIRLVDDRLKRVVTSWEVDARNSGSGMRSKNEGRMCC